MMQLFLCDLEVDAILELLPARDFDLPLVLTELRIDIPLWRAEQELKGVQEADMYQRGASEYNGGMTVSKGG